MTRLLRRCALPVTAMALLLALVGFTNRPSASLPPGTYSTTFTTAEIPSDFPAEARKNLAGKWVLTLSGENRFSVARDGKTIAGGRYSSTQDQFVLTDEEGPETCAGGDGAAATGTYKWTLDGKKLVLTAVEDNCSGRRFVLTFRPLMKET